MGNKPANMKKEVKLKTNYSCPYCDSYLRIWNNIIFTIHYDGGKKKGILLLDPALGNYSCTVHTEMKIKEGEKIEFFCPVCHESLTAGEINENLVRIIMSDENKQQSDVYFSRICGEESTFKITDNNIIAKFGKDDSHYVNYFLAKYKEQS
jgi:competence CoiA-like predicted nuclease